MDERCTERRSAWLGIGEDQAVPELRSQPQRRGPGPELPRLLAVGWRRGNGAVLVCAREGADKRPTGGFAPLALVRREGRPPRGKVHRAACDIAVNACRLELPQGKPPIADQ